MELLFCDVTSIGNTILHKDLILQLLNAITLHQKLAICKCVTDTTGTDVVSQGNRCAEDAVEQTVQQPLTDVLIATGTILDHSIQVKIQNNVPPTEKQKW